ncbi:MAG: uL15 family ribosomal protein [Nitrososphaerota archaeon]
MPTRLRKVRKRRGSRTHGWGQIGQHRKHGAKGGRGMAGGHKHKWTWVIKHAPDHFGEKGFHPPTSREVKAINLDQVSLIAEKLRMGGSAKSEDGKIVVDLPSLGYDKVLGKGRLTIPVKIVAKSWTSRAEGKVLASNSVIVAAE